MKEKLMISINKDSKRIQLFKTKRTAKHFNNTNEFWDYTEIKLKKADIDKIPNYPLRIRMNKTSVEFTATIV